MQQFKQEVNSEYEQMGKDWLDGKIEITEFEGIKLNPKQIEFVNDKNRFSLISGGMACVHGDTEIVDADTNEKIKIKDIKKPLRVYSWNGFKLVKAFASIPFKYQKTDLYEVTTTTGKFICTAKHRVLTEKGFLPVSSLGVGDHFLSISQIPLESISVSFRSKFFVNVLRYLQIGVSFLSYCLSYLRLCGRRLLRVLGIFLKIVPLQDDVPEYNLRDFYKDASLPLQANIYLSQGIYHLSNTDFSFPLYPRLLNEADYNEEVTSGRILHSFQLVRQFLLKTFFHPQKILTLVYNLFSYNKFNTITKVVQVRYHSFDNFYDLHVFGTNNYLAEGVIHHNSGKSLSWIIKFILLTQWFPGTRIMIGRKTKGNASETFMKDFVDVCPSGMYTHKVGEGKLIFRNGSEAVFFGLDALQAGSGDDLKKAIQQIKSHNFGFVFMDQLEEIEDKVFEALNSRVRRRQCKHGTVPDVDILVKRDKDGLPLYEVCLVCGAYTFNQFNMTTNPANFWGYDYFKVHPRPMTHLIETSMLDNKNNLSEQFIQSELAKPERYVKKFVYGEWSPDSLVEGGVFSEDYLKQQEFYLKEPIRSFDGIRIYHEPDYHYEYQIGVDSSEGAVDPCSIVVFNVDTGEQTAIYNQFVPVNVQVEKIMQLAMMYSLKHKPLLVIETNASGTAVIESVKKQYDNLYEREIFNYREQKKLKKLGFQTNFASKELLISNYNLLLSKKYVKIRDRNTLEEMKVFIYSDDSQQKGAGAQRGYHDDNVIATMLSCFNVKPKEEVIRDDYDTAEYIRIQENHALNRGHELL